MRGTAVMSPSACASRSAFPNAAVLPRLPAGSTIQSGASQPSCCSISSTIVFCPSTRNGLIELSEIDAEPLGAPRCTSAQAVVEVAAHQQRARAVRERLRELAQRHLARGHEHERRDARLRRVRRERRRRVAGATRTPRRARRCARACVTPTVIPRSLNEPVGLWPSCLSSSASTPAQRATRGAVEQRRVAFGVADDRCRPRVGSTSSRKRHTPERRAARPRSRCSR